MISLLRDSPQYATNITLGGQQFPIQLDTGSSDVWVQLPPGVNVKNTTNLTTELTFGIGQVDGNIAFADMQLGPHTVPSQGMSFLSWNLPWF